MRAVVQRVAQASVSVAGATVASIDRGLLVLLGVTHSDALEQAHALADKIAHLRVFPDAEGKMNRDLQAVAGSALVVSQFTLYGDCQKGRRPSYIQAARPEQAEPLYEAFVHALLRFGLPVQKGIFGAPMQVQLVNDGPVTLILDTASG